MRGPAAAVRRNGCREGCAKPRRQGNSASLYTPTHSSLFALGHRQHHAWQLPRISLRPAATCRSSPTAHRTVTKRVARPRSRSHASVPGVGREPAPRQHHLDIMSVRVHPTAFVVAGAEVEGDISIGAGESGRRRQPPRAPMSDTSGSERRQLHPPARQGDRDCRFHCPG